MDTRIKRDGKAYDSADVIVSLLGNIANEVSELIYGTTQEHQKNYSLGSHRATSWSMGKIEDTATITMSLMEANAIESATPDGDLLKIRPFDINVTFVNEYNKIINDTIICKFQSQGREVTGEMGLMKQYELFVLDIKYNNL